MLTPSLFLSRKIRPAGQGWRWSETNASAWELETGSKSSMSRWFFNMDAQDAQNFFRLD